MNDKIIGYTLLGIGIAIILFTFFEAYEFVSNLKIACSSSSSQPVGNDISLGNAVAIAIESSMPSQQMFYAIIYIAVFFLFGSLGYKIAIIGEKIIMDDNAGTKSNAKNGKEPERLGGGNGF
ncbi:MAG: hypothetical protein QXS03_01160 [Candidatus Micrarchaeaceae archaeon]